MTIDERATAYAEKTMEYVYSEEWDSEYVKELIETAYDDGAVEALASQWRSVEEELPEEMERVLVWTGDEALVCWFTSMRRFRTTLSCQERYIEDKSLGIKQHLSPCRADVTEVVTHWQRITPPSLPETNTEKK